MARRSKLHDPEFAKKVAELYLLGLTREQIAEELFIAYPDYLKNPPVPDTISEWTGDPRVQVHITAGSKARVNRITRRIDRELEGRITGEGIKQLDTETLLRIRKELLGKVPADKENEDNALPDLWDIIDSNPEVGEALSKALGGKK